MNIMINLINDQFLRLFFNTLSRLYLSSLLTLSLSLSFSPSSLSSLPFFLFPYSLSLSLSLSPDIVFALAATADDYSYFNSRKMANWAGPSHWKLRTTAAGERERRGGRGGEEGEREKRGKEKKRKREKKEGKMNGRKTRNN